ncbi:MAG: class I SAM-dependent methyltransferase [Acidimicrobiia bacterium]
MSTNTNLWVNDDHVEEYLVQREAFPHRNEAYGVVLEVLPERVERVLDLGTGDGDLLRRVLAARPAATGIGTDFNLGMLERAQERFNGDHRAEFVTYDFNDPWPSLGRFDVIVSAFAIHHVTDERKRSIYSDIYAALVPGGTLVNLEHVASPSAQLHDEFLEAMHIEEDRSNMLTPVEPQLEWLRAIGFRDVDCIWKWRELSVLFGRKAR